MQGISAIASTDIPSPREPSIYSKGAPFAAALDNSSSPLFYNNKRQHSSSKRDYSDEYGTSPVPKKKRRRTTAHSVTTDKCMGPSASDQLLQCHDNDSHGNKDTRRQQKKKEKKKKTKKNRPSGDEGEDRQRVSVACLECKKGHAKCGFERIDGKCARCARLGLPCTVPTVRKKRGPMSKKEREKLKKSADSKQTHTGGDAAQVREAQQQSRATVTMTVLQAASETERSSLQIEKGATDGGEQKITEAGLASQQKQQQKYSRLSQSRQTPQQKRRKSLQTAAIILNRDNGDDDNDTGKVEMNAVEMVALATNARAAKIQCPATGESCICRPSKAPLTSGRLGGSPNEEQTNNPASGIVDIEDIAVGLFGCENCTCMHNINNTCDLVVGQHTFNYGPQDPLYHGGIHGNDPLADVLGSDSSGGSSNGDDITDDPLEGLESMLSRAEVFHQQKAQEQQQQQQDRERQQRQQNYQQQQRYQQEEQQHHQHNQQQQELYMQERHHQHHRQDRQSYLQEQLQYHQHHQHYQHHYYQYQQHQQHLHWYYQQQQQQQQQQHYLKLLDTRLPQVHQLQQPHAANMTEDSLARLLLHFRQQQQQMPQHYNPQAYQQHYQHIHERQHSNPPHIIYPDVQQQHPYLQYG